ncbi:hypothetical protein ACOMHN_035731 [Nucella lapillus]
MDQGTGDCTQGQSTPATDTLDQGTGGCTQGQSTPATDTMDQGTGGCTQGQSTPATDTMDQGTGDCTQGQSTPVTDTMDQGTGDCTQGQSTPVTLTDTMDQGTGDCTQGQSTPATDTMDQGTGVCCPQGQLTADFVVKLEPAWSIHEESQDHEPSAGYSTGQPMSDDASDSPLSSRSSPVCWHCSAVFISFSCLQAHLQAFHGETLHSGLPVASRRHDSTCENDDQMVEPPASIKAEPQDEPSAVYSTVQPMSDNTSGSLLSIYASHVCHRCFDTFVLFSSLELHLATFHGETLHDLLSMYSAYNCYGAGFHHGSSMENAVAGFHHGSSMENAVAGFHHGSSMENAVAGFHHGSSMENAVGHNKKKGVGGRKEKAEDKGTDRTDREKSSRKHVCDVCSKAFSNDVTGRSVTLSDVMGRSVALSDVMGRSVSVTLSDVMV